MSRTISAIILTFSVVIVLSFVFEITRDVPSLDDPMIFQVEKPTKKHRDVLVVMFGNMRGGPLAWGSLKQHVLNPYNADLALLTDLNQCDSVLKNWAKFMWDVPEVSDWGRYIDSYYGNISWRNVFCPLKSDQFGAVRHCGHHKGSGSIGLVFREEMRQHIPEVKHYKWIVFTRSDFLYECNIPNFTNYDPSFAYVKSTGHHITTDRLIVVPQHLMHHAFNIMQFILFNHETWIEKELYHGGIEMAIAYYFKQTNFPFKYIDIPAGNVKRPTDATRWNGGQDFQELLPFNLKRKYWNNDKDIIQKLCGYEHKTFSQYNNTLTFYDLE